MLASKLNSDIFDSSVSGVELLDGTLTGDTNIIGNILHKGSVGDSTAVDVMASLNAKSPLNNPIFSGVVKQLFWWKRSRPFVVGAF